MRFMQKQWKAVISPTKVMMGGGGSDDGNAAASLLNLFATKTTPDVISTLNAGPLIFLGGEDTRWGSLYHRLLQSEYALRVYPQVPVPR